MTISPVPYSTLNKYLDDGDDELDAKIAIEDHKVQVGVNSRTMWLFKKDWTHVFAKVKRTDEGKYKLKIKNKKVFEKALGGCEAEVVLLGKLLITDMKKKGNLPGLPGIRS